MIRSIAVHATDVVDAVEAVERDRGETVLRVTPPFSARMRARIHITGIEDYEPNTSNAPIHIHPDTLVPDRPPFPTPDRTADELRAAEDRTYDRETHHEYHQSRVQDWRAAVAGSIVDRISLPVAEGEHAVDIRVLDVWEPDDS